MIDQDVEEAHNLRRVQIQYEYPLGSGSGEQVGYELGGNGFAAGGFSVLAAVAVIGHDHIDAPAEAAFGSIEQDKQLHQIFVNRRTGRLDKKTISPLTLSCNLHIDFTI